MNCPIHLGEIALDTDRAAALPCGHVFCLPCITTYFDAKRAKSGPCPICKKVTTKKQLMPLFLQPKSPCPSPVKKELVDHMPAVGRAHAHTLHQHLQTFEANGCVDNAFKACAEMGHFADCITGTPNLEAICLAEEIKTAAMRLQAEVLPKLKELASVRTRAQSLEEANTFLKSTLHLKDMEIDNQNRRRTLAERELADIKMIKRFADDKTSSLREALSVKSERLIDAENTIRDKDELITKKDADIKQYKRWASDHKIKTEGYKTKIKGLEMRISRLEQTAHSTSPGESSSREAIADAPPSILSTVRDPEHRDLIEPLERTLKRRRIEEKLTSADIKLEKGCFVIKPPPSFRISAEERPGKRAASTSGLNITNNGQVKGPVVLGSRQRMGRRG